MAMLECAKSAPFPTYARNRASTPAMSDPADAWQGVLHQALARRDWAAVRRLARQVPAERLAAAKLAVEQELRRCAQVEPARLPVQRRCALEQLLAELRTRLGEPGVAQVLLLRRWAAGGSAVPLLQALFDEGQRRRACALARVAQARAASASAAEVDAMLQGGGTLAARWLETALRLVTEPQGPPARQELAQRWLVLRNAPPACAERGLVLTAQLLERLGAPSDALFRGAAALGVTCEAWLLARLGLADPLVVERHALSAPHAERHLWLALAARAAMAQDRPQAAAELLHRALACSPRPQSLQQQVLEIWRDADEVTLDMLRRTPWPP